MILITAASRRVEPVIKCCVPFIFSSRFQGPAFDCDKIVVIVTLLEAIEGIPDKDFITFWGMTSSPIFTRDYFMSENFKGNLG